jgi:signal transduction histidine kinase
VEVPGSGVGLALVKKAMERMGGKVWARSSPGQGATFFIELPSAKTGGPEAPGEMEPAEAESDIAG